MNQTYDVIIIGAGVIGLTTALVLKENNFSVAVLDTTPNQKQPNPKTSRVFALNKRSQQLLMDLNIWQGLGPKSVKPYTHMHVWEFHSGAHIDFDARMIQSDRLGTIVLEEDLKNVLMQRSQDLEIEIFTGITIHSIAEMDTEIHLKGNETFGAKFLIAADGGGSKVRELLNVSISQHSYHQNAIVTTVKNSLQHQNTAYQVFHNGEPLAFLPLSDSHQCSIVWSVSPSKAGWLKNLSNEEFNLQLGIAFKEKLGKSEVISSREQFPLSMRHVEKYTGSKWLILGDAAHTIHPLAGLGLNVGFADIIALQKMVEKSPGFIPSQKNLNAYHRERTAAVWQIILMLAGIKQLFTTSFLPFAVVRNFGLRFCNQLTLLKKFFITQAQ